MLRITINVSDELGESIKIAAQKCNQSVSSYISKAMIAHLLQFQKTDLGQGLCQLIGKAGVTADTMSTLKEMRKQNDHRV